MEATKLKVKSESRERKVPIFLNTRKPMPNEEDFDLVCRMADDARRHKMDMDEKAAHYALKAQIAAKNSSDWEYQRWSMHITMNRWNKNV